MTQVAKVGKAINITCESVGVPKPSFIITHNDTEVVANTTYNIPQVKWSDGGLYQCIATNELGSNSKSYCLTVLGKIIVQANPLLIYVLFIAIVTADLLTGDLRARITIGKTS